MPQLRDGDGGDFQVLARLSGQPACEVEAAFLALEDYIGIDNYHDYILDVTSKESYYTHPVEGEKFPEDKDSMTIGIGVLCQDAKCILLASDSRASHATNSPNDLCAKMFDLVPFQLSCCIAGRVSRATSVGLQICAQLRGIEISQAKRASVMAAIDEGRFNIHEELINVRMLKEMSTSLERWRVGPLDPYLHRDGKKLICTTELGVQLVVGGFLNHEPILLRTIGLEPMEEEFSPGVFLIGTSVAVTAAHAVLARRKQCVQFGFARTLFHLHEALEAAKKATPRLVGGSISYLARTERSAKRFPSNSNLLKKWMRSAEFRKSSKGLEDDARTREVAVEMLPHSPMLLTSQT